MTSLSTPVPEFSSLPSNPDLPTSQQDLTITKNLSNPSNSPTLSSENDSPTTTKWKETDDDTLVDYNSVYKDNLENKQNPSKISPSKENPTDIKRMSEEDDDQPQNLETITKKQRTSLAQYKEVPQTVEKPPQGKSRPTKESKKAKENQNKSDSAKEPLHKRNLDTNLSGDKPSGLAATLHDDEIRAITKQCKKIRVVYSDAQKQLNFTLDYLNQGNQTMQSIELTRNQMLTYNPKLVLMFYEKNLQFPLNPEFDLNALKQV
jgi:hypothetical protein